MDIPQHPVALHGMVTRGSKQLSSTLQELRVTRTSSRLSRLPAEEEQQSSPNHQPTDIPIPSASFTKSSVVEKSLLQPLVMQFSFILQVSYCDRIIADMFIKKPIKFFYLSCC